MKSPTATLTSGLYAFSGFVTILMTNHQDPDIGLSGETNKGVFNLNAGRPAFHQLQSCSS